MRRSRSARRSGRYECPLCQSPLSRARWLAVTKEHAGLHRAIERAQAEAARYRKAREEADRARKELAARHREDLKAAREEAAARGARKATAGLARELRGTRNQLARERGKLTGYQKRMDRYATRLDEQNQEIARLREQVAKGTTPQLEGLLEEGRLLAVLRQFFPRDRFDHPGKGGDIVQTVICDGESIGVIVYECKRVKVFHQRHVVQAAQAGRQRSATYALLVTNCLPKKRQHCWVERGVIVITPQAVIAVAATARSSLESLHRLRASEAERERAVRAIYDYLAGAEYRARIDNAAAELEALAEQLTEERRWHDRAWRRRAAHYATVAGEVQGLDTRLQEFLKRSNRTRVLPLVKQRGPAGSPRGQRRGRRRTAA